MAYVPLQVIIDALGDVIPANASVRDLGDHIVNVDKQALVNALASKGVIASTSQSLLDLIALVAALVVNYQLTASEMFPSLMGGMLTEDAVVNLFNATISTADETFIVLSLMPEPTGNIWLTQKWNAVMSGNNTPAQYFASASSEEPGFEAWHAFDNTNATDMDAWLTTTGMVTGYLQYRDSGGGAIVTEYYLTSRNAASGGSEAPKSWTFEGSNDGMTWFVLDTQVGVVFGNNELKKFSFINTTSYSYYKLNVTLNNGSANFVAVGELEIRNSTVGTISF